MNNIMLSIIVPVFNTEKYVARCLNSLINQSINEIEIIVINDGSPDHTYDIVKTFLSNPKIKYVDLKNNNGVGYARNIGLGQAIGKYIAFVDSDDWVDLDLYQMMCSSLEKTHSDICVCGVKNEWNNFLSTTTRYKYIYPNVINSSQAIDLLAKNTRNNFYLSPVVWNKVYRRDLLINNKIKFIDNSYWEDDIFTIKVLAKSNKISFVPEVFYHYYHRDDSITSTISKKHIDDLIFSFASLKKDISNDNHISANQYQSLLDRCICSLMNMIQNNEKCEETKKKYVVYFLESFLNNFSLKEAIEYLDTTRLMRLFH